MLTERRYLLLKSYQLYMLNIVMNSLGTEDEVNHTRNNGPLDALTRDYDKGPLDALTRDYLCCDNQRSMCPIVRQHLRNTHTI